MGAELGASPTEMRATASSIDTLKSEFKTAYDNFYDTCGQRLSRENNGTAIFYGNKAGETLSNLERAKPEFEQICDLLQRASQSLVSQAENIERFDA